MPERTGGVGEQRGEPLHPPVDRDVVDVDAPFGQQLLRIPIRQPVAQVPADRQRDHLGTATAGSGPVQQTPLNDYPLTDVRASARFLGSSPAG